MRGIMHNLNNVLSNISGSEEIIVLEGEKHLTKNQRECVRIINSSCKKLKKAIGDLKHSIKADDDR